MQVTNPVFKKINNPQQYDGPVNYISIVDAYKQGPHSTTPIRLCMNSSLKFAGNSLNDLLYKGPSALNDLYGVLLDFRRHQVGLVKDLSKFYQSVDASERDQHVRRVLWRFGDEEKDPDVYITTTVNFGDKPAGCVAQVALRETAKMYRAMDPAAAQAIIESTYCDDTLCGSDDRSLAQALSDKMDGIVAQGGFKYKNLIMSGDPGDGEERKVLGTGWDTEKDLLYVDCKINFCEKKKGLKTGPDIEPEKVEELAPNNITRRMVWRVALGQYDVLGLISPFLIRLKLIMRDLSKPDEEVCEKNNSKARWDKPISPELREIFLQIISQLEEAKALRFPRCVVPEGCAEDEDPMLLVLVDGSKSASCALVYGRWRDEGGNFHCRLITGKTRVAPLKKISVPRMELQGAVAGVRLADKVQNHLKINFKKRRFFTDSSAVLGMLTGDMSTFQEFVGTRVSEIRSKSDAKTEWSWIPTDKNLADLGTRAAVVPDDLSAESDYQNGMDWMRDAEETWPTEFKKGPVPEEEKLKSARVNFSRSGRAVTDPIIDLTKFKSFTKLLSVTSLVMLAVDKFKSKGQIKKLEKLSKEAAAKLKMEAAVYRSRSENYWLIRQQEDERAGFKANKYVSLRARLVSIEGMGELVVVSGRLGENLTIGYDKKELPLLEPSNKLSRMIMSDAHNFNHSGPDKTLLSSRSTAWIIRGGNLSKQITKNCFKCKIINQSLAEQIMAPLPQQRLPPSPPFSFTAVDLFGPYKVRDTVKKRVTKETYGVIFTCMVTSAVHLEATDDYSTDAFLLALRRFMSLRGTPSYMQSDPGTQLKAAGKEVELWRCEEVVEFAAGRRIKWRVVPTAAQHCNGLAERMIGVTKKVLKSLLYESVLTKSELDTLLAEAGQIVNSRPLMLKSSSDPWSMGPITPNHLLHGRATISVPVVEFSDNIKLTKRLQFIQELKDQFWRKWICQVFPNLLPSYKWRSEERNLQVGDVVLIKEESKISSSYKLGRVAEVFNGEDGKVRRARVEYKNVDASTSLDKAPMMSTERSVHGLVVIVPADFTNQQIEDSVSEDIKHNALKNLNQ